MVVCSLLLTLSLSINNNNSNHLTVHFAASYIFNLLLCDIDCDKIFSKTFVKDKTMKKIKNQNWNSLKIITAITAAAATKTKRIKYIYISI